LLSLFTLLRDMVGLITSPWVRRHGVFKRIFLLVAVAAMMAVMMVTSAAPAFAFPTDPLHGQKVSAVAKFYPVDPVREPGPYQGQRVSAVANPFQGCAPNEDVC
jgi:hypothetical protein